MQNPEEGQPPSLPTDISPVERVELGKTVKDSNTLQGLGIKPSTQNIVQSPGKCLWNKAFVWLSH